MIVCVNSQTLDIVSWYEGSINKQSEWGGEMGNPELTLHIFVPDGLDIQCMMAVRENDEIVVKNDPIKIQAKLDIEWSSLRAERNRRLMACDWTRLDDAPQINKEAWAEYRQALRNLPENVVDPTNVTWPVAPLL